MARQRNSSYESFITRITLVGLFTCMYSHVSCQKRWIRESGLAKCARVWLCPSVSWLLNDLRHRLQTCTVLLGWLASLISWYFVINVHKMLSSTFHIKYPVNSQFTTNLYKKHRIYANRTKFYYSVGIKFLSGHNKKEYNFFLILQINTSLDSEN